MSCGASLVASLLIAIQNCRKLARPARNDKSVELPLAQRGAPLPQTALPGPTSDMLKRTALNAAQLALCAYFRHDITATRR
jgi:hypothetical protein